MTIKNVAKLVSSELLPRIRQPGQYIGLEINACCKNINDAEVTVALAFPDNYTIGISHMGNQVLYHMLNKIEAVVCDRAYCPNIDAEQVMRDHDIPLFGWESRCALRDFDIIGFSLAYEACATNVLTMLDLAGIPLHSTDRTADDPIIIGGDAFADSPEAVAEFFDIFIAGEGEEPLTEFVQLVKSAKQTGMSRDDILLQAAKTITGVYCPRFYEPQYNPDGTLAAFGPTRDDVPAVIQHATQADFATSPMVDAPLVPLSEGVHERVIIEIMRGCPNGCRFCQAGHARLPLRYRSVDCIMDYARRALAATGYSEISLLSLSTSDYPHLDELIERLNTEFSGKNISISLPSLRVDSQLQQLPKLTSCVRKSGFTIAAETALPKIRKAIGKDISDDDMIAGVQAAYHAGWKSVKVYFMVGFPTESQEDIEGIVKLCKRLSWTRKAVDNHKGAISASVSWFVPKPHTPMQWTAMQDFDYFMKIRNDLRDMSKKSPVTVKFHWIERSHLEVALCRGDRRMSKVIEAAWRNGARMDAWNEHFKWEHWTAAFEETGIDPAFYRREIAPDEILPWAHIQCKHDHAWLAEQREQMQAILNEE